METPSQILDQYAKILEIFPLAELVKRKCTMPLEYAEKRHEKLEALNHVYSSVVWGLRNSALNRKPRSDELKVIDTYLDGKPWGAKVLEVGSGSGRVSVYLAAKTQLTCLDKSSSANDRLQDRLKTLKLKATIIHQDIFTWRSSEKYTAIALFENFYGAVLSATARAKLLTICSAHLEHKGLLIFGLRCGAGNCHQVQVLPYFPVLARRRINVAGHFILWSSKKLAREFRTLDGFRLRSMHEGEPRPAGGKMWHFVLEKLG
jgi:SAM-dependent methyltransferase